MKVVFVTIAGALLLPVPPPRSASARTSPLRPLTPADVRAAGAGGTGCSWMPRKNGPVLLAMAGGKAVVSVGGKAVLLSPDPRARALFPFTFDRWRGGTLALTIHKATVGRRIGNETLGYRTDLTLSDSARQAVLSGWMECGS